MPRSRSTGVWPFAMALAMLGCDRVSGLPPATATRPQPATSAPSNPEPPAKPKRDVGSCFGIPNEFSGKLTEEQERSVPEPLRHAWLVEAVEDVTGPRFSDGAGDRRPIAEETHDGQRYVAVRDHVCVTFEKGVSGMMIVIRRYRVHDP